MRRVRKTNSSKLMRSGPGKSKWTMAMRTVARSRARKVRVSFSAIKSSSSYFSGSVMGKAERLPL
jgi:putative protein kinase ArgK-like GTPase of G3E family